MPKPTRQTNVSFSRPGSSAGCTITSGARTTCSCACRGWCASSCSTARPARPSSADIGDDNPVAVYVPGRLAHGYEALTDALFCYEVTEEYDPDDPDEHEVPWNDPRVRHLWSTQSPILSERDTAAAS